MGALGVLIVGAAGLAGGLAYHAGDEHAVVVHEGEGAVRADHDVVRFEVAVGEGLREQPLRQLGETPGQETQGGLVALVRRYVLAQDFALDPVHEHHGHEAIAGPQFLGAVVYGDKVLRAHVAQVVAYAAVGVLAFGLLLGEALEGHEAAVRAAELEDHGEVAGGHYGFAVAAADYGVRFKVVGLDAVGLGQTVDVVGDGGERHFSSQLAVHSSQLRSVHSAQCTVTLGVS